MSGSQLQLFKVVLDSTGLISIRDAGEPPRPGDRQIGQAGNKEFCVQLIESAMIGQEPTISIPPGDNLQQLIAEAWKNILGDALRLPTIGIHDNFFEIGGTSLALRAVGAELSRSLGRSIADINLFRYPTIASLAAHLSTNTTGEVPTQAVRTRAARQRAALSRRQPVRKG